MKEQTANKAKLGTFVIIATTALILGLYYIGSKKNIFHSTINISANFGNVSGLMPGNNVRFNGIDVGIVTKVFAVADTAIKVEFTIDEEATKFISIDAIASIGTDGLLGNKLVNIFPGNKKIESVKEGSILKTLKPIQMDNELRTLTMTNANLKIITDNLKGISEKFNDNNSLWHLLSDSSLAENVRTVIVRFKLTGTNAAVITGDLSDIVKDIKAGKGSIGALLTDTSFSNNLNQTVVKIQTLSDSVAIITGDFNYISKNLRNGKGSIGTLLTDTAFVHNLNQSMITIKSAANSFDENMEALHYSWPFKKYFKKQKKASNLKQ